MAPRLGMLALVFLITLGCVYQRQPMDVPTVQHIVSPYQQYVDKSFDWSRIRRVVMMPVANQTVYPTINQEIHTNLAAELQRAGYFEIVLAKIDDPAVRSQDVFTSGRFNEIEAVRVTREYQSDAILFVNVTQYHPYKPPRLGLNMLLVYPAEGITVASLSGFWDAREAQTLQLAQAYLRQNQSWPRSLMAQDRIVQVPDVFQRFVCQQVAVAFHPPVLLAAAAFAPADNSDIPAERPISVETPLPVNTQIPTLPPAPPMLPAP